MNEPEPEQPKHPLVYQVELLDPKEGQVILIRVSTLNLKILTDVRYVCSQLAELFTRKKLRVDMIAFCNEEFDLKVIDEKSMNEAGWYKKEERENLIELVQ